MSIVGSPWVYGTFYHTHSRDDPPTLRSLVLLRIFFYVVGKKQNAYFIYLKIASHATPV